MAESECEHCRVDPNGILSKDIPCICGPGVMCGLCTHVLGDRNQYGIGNLEILKGKYRG